jgi:hypothetical protein
MAQHHQPPTQCTALPEAFERSIISDSRFVASGVQLSHLCRVLMGVGHHKKTCACLNIVYFLNPSVYHQFSYSPWPLYGCTHFQTRFRMNLLGST